jgi:ABC-type lipoprotein release transport system permease subunit
MEQVVARSIAEPRLLMTLVGALLFAVAAASSVMPALRILRLDPARTLRD